MSHAAPSPGITPERPLLPLSHLLKLSIYWLGINTIWGGLNSIILPSRVNAIDAANAGFLLAVMSGAAVLVAIVVQPTVGMISDYTVTRWGKRKPYIVIGATLDVVFLFGIAASQTYLTILAFLVLLQFSSNFAQGPFQGYVPDLVPAHQVGLASALVGLFQILGNGAGFALGSLAVGTGSFFLGTMALGALELATMLSVVIRVHEGRPPRDRAGRSWLAIAREGWSTDILRERSFMWLLASRWFVLMGANSLINTATFFAAQTLGLSQQETGEANLFVLVFALSGNVLTVIPAGRLSDRIGRKPVIYIACALSALGLAVVAAAPSVEVAAVAAGLFGAGIGMFLAVDWALMTDIIPKASSGRYMGISNVATATSGIVQLMSAAVVLDVGNAVLGYGVGPRLVFALAVVFLVIGAFLLRPVDPRPREERLAAEAAAEAAAG